MNHYYTLLHTIIIMIYVIAIFSNKQKFKQNVNTFRNIYSERDFIVEFCSLSIRSDDVFEIVPT